MSTQCVVALLLLATSCLSLANVGGWRDVDVNGDDTQAVGGWRDVDVNGDDTQEVKELAASCVDELSARSNSMFKAKLMTLESAQVQVRLTITKLLFSNGYLYLYTINGPDLGLLEFNYG